MLNCDFKSYRCKSYYLPILIKMLKNKNLFIGHAIEQDELVVNDYLKSYFFLFLKKGKKFNFNLSKNNTRFLVRQSTWFTKNTNLEKLFVVGYKMFLSSGIILNYLNTPYKFLRKRLKTWFGYLTAFFKLFPFTSLMYFTNMFGNKFNLIERVLKLKKKKIWIFVKLFYLNFIFIKKKKKRIKRWITKKYYRYLTSS